MLGLYHFVFCTEVKLYRGAPRPPSAERRWLRDRWHRKWPDGIWYCGTISVLPGQRKLFRVSGLLLVFWLKVMLSCSEARPRSIN